MLISTPSQWAILALVLVAGWFFGLASHSGGRKWKDRYAAERDAHAAHRKDVDARVTDSDRRVTDSDRRIAELERENARLASAVPSAGVATSRPATSIRPAASARPAYPAGERRGWFDWGNRP